MQVSGAATVPQGQLGFIQFIVRPLFDALAEVIPEVHLRHRQMGRIPRPHAICERESALKRKSDCASLLLVERNSITRRFSSFVLNPKCVVSEHCEMTHFALNEEGISIFVHLSILCGHALIAIYFMQLQTFFEITFSG